MSQALCLPHKNRGETINATKLIGTTPMCQDCADGKPIPTKSRFTEPSIHVRDEGLGEVPHKSLEHFGFAWKECAKACGRKVRPNNKTGICYYCQPKREKAMPQGKKVDATGMQNDRSDGMSVADIASKYGCSTFTVYNKTKAGNAKRAIVTTSTSGRANGIVRKSNGTHHSLLSELRAKRDALDRAITNVEEAIKILDE